MILVNIKIQKSTSASFKIPLVKMKDKVFLKRVSKNNKKMLKYLKDRSCNLETEDSYQVLSYERFNEELNQFNIEGELKIQVWYSISHNMYYNQDKNTGYEEVKKEDGTFRKKYYQYEEIVIKLSKDDCLMELLNDEVFKARDNHAIRLVIVESPHLIGTYWEPIDLARDNLTN